MRRLRPILTIALYACMFLAHFALHLTSGVRLVRGVARRGCAGAGWVVRASYRTTRARFERAI